MSHFNGRLISTEDYERITSELSKSIIPIVAQIKSMGISAEMCLEYLTEEVADMMASVAAPMGPRTLLVSTQGYLDAMGRAVSRVYGVEVMLRTEERPE